MHLKNNLPDILSWKISEIEFFVVLYELKMKKLC